ICPANSQRDTPLASLSFHWVTIWRPSVASRIAEAVQPTMSGFTRCVAFRQGRARCSPASGARRVNRSGRRQRDCHPRGDLIRVPSHLEPAMPDPRELEEKFWKALEDDRTVMLGIDGQEDGHARPMTTLSEERRSPIWFFTSAD